MDELYETVTDIKVLLGQHSLILAKIEKDLSGDVHTEGLIHRVSILEDAKSRMTTIVTTVTTIAVAIGAGLSWLLDHIPFTLKGN